MKSPQSVSPAESGTIRGDEMGARGATLNAVLAATLVYSR